MANRKELERNARFANLRDGEEYFPGVEMTLWPNDEHGVIWVRDAKGRNAAFSIKISSGKSGLGVTIGKFAGGLPLTVSGNRHGDMEPIQSIDAYEVTVTQYFPDERSQAYKQWYGLHQSPENDTERAVYNQGIADAKLDEADHNFRIFDDSYDKMWRAGYYAHFAGIAK